MVKEYRSFDALGKGSNPYEQKKCEDCGKMFIPKERWHRRCYDCQASKSGSREREKKIHEKNHRLALPWLDTFLDGAGNIRKEIYSDFAQQTAKILQSGENAMKYTALCRFFQIVRAIQQRYKIDGNFGKVKERLASLIPKASHQVKRGIAPSEFEKFVSSSVTVARKSPQEFRGFVEYFSSVVAFSR